MGFALGFNAKLKYKVGGQAAGGSYVELGNCRDVTLNCEMGEADATTRGNGGFNATVATLMSAPIEFEMVWDTADPGFAAIRTAFFSRGILAFQVLDADSGEGLQADFQVFNFSRAEPLDGVQLVSVSIKITYSATAPSWIGA